MSRIFYLLFFFIIFLFYFKFFYLPKKQTDIIPENLLEASKDVDLRQLPALEVASPSVISNVPDNNNSGKKRLVSSEDDGEDGPSAKKTKSEKIDEWVFIKLTGKLK